MARSPVATKSVQRTLEYLRGEGYECGIAEHWNAFTKQRYDLFGFIDLICLVPGNPGRIVGIQCCAGSGLAAHRHKILEECGKDAIQWLESGGFIEIWAWRKIKLKRGGKAMRWKPKVERIGRTCWSSSSPPGISGSE